MPSPFPGMNPYLEHSDPWHDFHDSFITLAKDLIVPQVRPEFIVKIDRHVYIHEMPFEERQFVGRSDLHVAAIGPLEEKQAAVATLHAPVQGRLPVAIDFEKHTFLEIRDREDRSLVALLELLSPVNKKYGADRDQFLAKRKEILASSASYIEIDLLRGGPRLPIHDLPDCDYYAMVSRWEHRPIVGIWPLRLRDPLPMIPIPLPAPKLNAHLDLQAMVHRLYDAGGFEDYIYSHNPDPPLHPDDAAWAKKLIPAQTPASRG